VRPTSIMGATKRLAELVCQALATTPNCTTQFSMVRFGNVLGSSGSVIPLFKKQLAQGGPLTVTDPEMTRYFMTIPEAAQLVLQAGAMGTGGDVFLLDMGEPIKIVDLAKKMILLSGFNVGDHQNSAGDIAIEFTGLRSGEKLYEELLIDLDIVERTEHTLIMRSKEKFYAMAEIELMLERMVQAASTQDVDLALTQIEKFVEGYQRSHVYS
jgi:FlaA1/EpsC-like NDP-sugar epimerase